jgi:hypothetical protein
MSALENSALCACHAIPELDISWAPTPGSEAVVAVEAADRGRCRGSAIAKMFKKYQLDLCTVHQLRAELSAV